MAKTKYRYNPETLTYEEVKLTTREKVIRSIIFILPSILLMVLGGVVALLFVPTRTEQQQAKIIDQERQVNTESWQELNARAEFALKVMSNIRDRDNNLLRVTYGMDKYPDHLQNLAVGGSDRYAKYKGVETSDIIVETAKRLDSLERALYAQSKSFDEIEKIARSKPDMLAALPSIQPISNKDLTRISSGFGMRMHPIYHIPQMHTGIDMTADVGAEIYASGNGVVEKVDWMGGYGKIVIIDHGFGYKTYYAHCSGFNVREGQKVTRGEVIAYVGNTGMSTGPHLHYEVRKKMKDPASGRYYYKPVDPVHYFYNDLTPEEYEQVIEIAAKATYALS